MMDTTQLITLLSRDAAGRSAPLSLWMLVAIGVGLAASFILFLAALGFRSNLGLAMASPWFVLKLGLVLSLGLSLVPLARAAAQPGHAMRWALLLIAPLLLILAIGLDLTMLGPQNGMRRLIGTNARVCLTFVPLLSLAPLGLLLLWMRSCAVTAPGQAGALAGLLAGAFGATLYALHCPDDSPLFVAVWYGLGIAIVTALGTVLGSKILRW